MSRPASKVRKSRIRAALDRLNRLERTAWADSASAVVQERKANETALEAVQREAFFAGMLAGKLGKGDGAWLQWRDANRKAKP